MSGNWSNISVTASFVLVSGTGVMEWTDPSGKKYQFKGRIENNCCKSGKVFDEFGIIFEYKELVSKPDVDIFGQAPFKVKDASFFCTSQSYTRPNITCYEGNVRMFRPELFGEGKVYNTDGSGNGKMYRGRWKNGLYDGKGVLSYIDGTLLYEGEFKSGLYHGHGVLRESHFTFIGTFDLDVKTAHLFGGLLAIMLFIPSFTFQIKYKIWWYEKCAKMKTY